MTPQQIVGLSVRLFSIWLVVLALQIIGIGDALNSQPGIESTNVPFLLSGITISLAILLWLFPMVVAHKLVPKTQFDNILHVPVQEAVHVACIIFALWLFLAKVLPNLAYYIPLFMVIIYDKQPISSYEQFHFMKITPIVIEFAVAMLLAFKANVISKFLLTPKGESKNE